MNFKGIDICCPQCRGELDRPRESELVCRACSHRFPVLLDIPDLRIFPDPYVDVETERQKAFRIAERFHEFDFRGLVDFYYSITDVVKPELAEKYKASLFAAEARARSWLAAWEADAGGPGTALVEIGCGTAPLLLAAKNYKLRVGVDIAFRWLVMGKKRLADAGLDLPLICACAEALPFRAPFCDRAVADSTIEHFTDQPKALAEIHRVMRLGAYLYIATPNRFTLGPDPQTKIWMGTWLPKKWTDAIVVRSGGLAPQRTLLTRSGLEKLLRGVGFDEIKILLPTFPEEQRRYLSKTLRWLVRAYDLAGALPVSRQLLFLFGPLFLATARKPPASH